MGTHVSLDDYAVEAYRAYLAAVEAIREATASKDKARDALITFLRLSEADTAELDGEPVLRLVESDRVSLDAARLKDEEPWVYRRFAQVSHVEYLRKVDGAA